MSTVNITVSLGAPAELGQNFSIILARTGVTPIERIATANEGGVLSVIDIPQGQYTVWVKHPLTLAVAQPVTVNTPAVAVNFGTFKLGDANSDNVINIADFSILAASFGRAAGAVGYEARADFDNDMAITIADFSLLAANFGQTGAAQPPGSGGPPDAPASAPPPELTSARIRLQLNNSPVRVNQPFTVTVRIGNSSASAASGAVISQLNGGEVHLRFDPTRLRVESTNGLTSGSSLTTSLISRYDNTAGTIDFAAGTFDAAVSGEFTLVTIRFRPIASTGSGTTLVQAQVAAPARTNLLALNGQVISPTITPLAFGITP